MSEYKPFEYADLETIIDYEKTVARDDFTKLFGKHVGGHLWRKFAEKYDRNLLRFASTLDVQNMALLAGAINDHKFGLIYFA